MGNAEFNHTNTPIEKVQNSAVQRGGFQIKPLNMEELSRQLSPEYLTYQQTLNSQILHLCQIDSIQLIFLTQGSKSSLRIPKQER